jgi:carbonic anhydrase/acetyltransferase-like protein (isoleucine patch superfamily)
MKLPLYDLEPRTENNWIAPSATIIGEVQVRRFASIWYNAVVRGDINKVEVGNFSSIGENTVLHTAPSLPTGMQAKLTIGRNCTIGSNCTLYSC